MEQTAAQAAVLGELHVPLLREQGFLTLPAMAAPQVVAEEEPDF